jgi:predicted alpha/beta hydrolase
MPDATSPAVPARSSGRSSRRSRPAPAASGVSLASIMLPARDGHLLAVDVHIPVATPVRAVAIVAPAMGVKRGFYRGFAAYLAEAGIAALVPDYRGIGGSRTRALRGDPTVLHEWADLDLAALVSHAHLAFAGRPLLWVGHSVGGQLLGLLPQAPVRRALMVGSQHGHWRSWEGWPRFAMAALWWLGIPALTALTGRLPMSTFGQGEDLPAGVARQWARWGRDRDYIVGFARRRGDSNFERFTGDLRLYAVTDDSYAPPSSVHALARAYQAARAEVIEVGPRDVGLPALGHFGGFRSSAQPLWEAWRTWLLAGLPDATP